MTGSSLFDRAIDRVSSHRTNTHWGCRPKRPFRLAHNALMSLILFLVAFLMMGIPVFASSGGPPISRHATVAYRSAPVK
jgi:hypothetical protein